MAVVGFRDVIWPRLRLRHVTLCLFAKESQIYWLLTKGGPPQNLGSVGLLQIRVAFIRPLAELFPCRIFPRMRWHTSTRSSEVVVLRERVNTSSSPVHACCRGPGEHICEEEVKSTHTQGRADTANDPSLRTKMYGDKEAGVIRASLKSTSAVGPAWDCRGSRP